MILVLDAWSVHRSQEFRTWMARNHPLMHLVFVPANCTSHLQVADVVLQRSFKAKIRDRFSDWAAAIIKQQAIAGAITGLRDHLGVGELRQHVLEWTLAAWNHLASPAGKESLLKGWFTCVRAHFDVWDAEQRKKAVQAAAKGELKAYDFLPEESEPENHGEDVWQSENDDSIDEENDELDVTKPVRAGERKSKRAKTDRQRDIGSYLIDSSQIELSSDEAE